MTLCLIKISVNYYSFRFECKSSYFIHAIAKRPKMDNTIITATNAISCIKINFIPMTSSKTKQHQVKGRYLLLSLIAPHHHLCQNSHELYDFLFLLHLSKEYLGVKKTIYLLSSYLSGSRFLLLPLSAYNLLPASAFQTTKNNNRQKSERMHSNPSVVQ